MDKKKTTVNIRYIFNFCNDIEEIREFYSDLVGLEEVSFKDDDEWGWVVYQSEGFQFMWFRSDEELPVIDGWANQPGYEGGEYALISWSIEVPKADFEAIVERLKASGAKLLSMEPEWRQDSYWGFTVMDPMGNTVEIFYEDDEDNNTKEK